MDHDALSGVLGEEELVALALRRLAMRSEEIAQPR
jgi:hypothetical protein